MPPRVRLVVVNYDGGEDVLTCLAHLAALDWPADDLEVVVVDNASTDGSREAIAERFPAARLIANPTNTGFPANNLGFDGLADGGPDYVGLVNSDAFVEPGYLRPLVDALAADPRLGAACPKVLLADRFVPWTVTGERGTRLDGPPGAVATDGWERPDSLGDGRPRLAATGASARLHVPEGASPATFDPPVGASAAAAGPPVDLVNNVGNELRAGWFGGDRGLHDPDDGRYDEPVEVFAWCGAAVLFPAAYLRDVGGFDERLFLYYEDLDLAWAGRSRGWTYRTVPAAVVRHRHGGSSQLGSTLFRRHVERNRLVVLLVHAPLGVALGAAARHLRATASYALHDLPGPAAARSGLVGLRLRAFAAYLRLVPHALARRRAIEGRATVSRPARVAGWRP